MSLAFRDVPKAVVHNCCHCSSASARVKGDPLFRTRHARGLQRVEGDVEIAARVLD
jgi:hypothetical protein